MVDTNAIKQDFRRQTQIHPVIHALNNTLFSEHPRGIAAKALDITATICSLEGDGQVVDTILGSCRRG